LLFFLGVFVVALLLNLVFHFWFLGCAQIDVGVFALELLWAWSLLDFLCIGKNLLGSLRNRFKRVV